MFLKLASEDDLIKKYIEFQKRQQEIRQKQAELQEHNRLQRVNLFDEMATEQYNKVNQKMLGNN